MTPMLQTIRWNLKNSAHNTNVTNNQLKIKENTAHNTNTNTLLH